MSSVLHGTTRASLPISVQETTILLLSILSVPVDISICCAQVAEWSLFGHNELHMIE